MGVPRIPLQESQLTVHNCTSYPCWVCLNKSRPFVLPEVIWPSSWLADENEGIPLHLTPGDSFL